MKSVFSSVCGAGFKEVRAEVTPVPPPWGASGSCSRLPGGLQPAVAFRGQVPVEEEGEKVQEGNKGICGGERSGDLAAASWQVCVSVRILLSGTRSPFRA